MNLFDIIGPVMVGPSSSHTAGAVKIGLAAGKLLGEKVVSAEILLYGSFLATGKGHGTDAALVAGLLGMKMDDENIPKSLEIAKERGLQIKFGKADLKDAHPNSVEMRLVGEHGRKLSIVGESIGGSLINIAKIDGLDANFSGDFPTLIIHNEDQPGHLAEVTGMLARSSINVATMQLYRASRGGEAVMVIECDQEVPEETLEWLQKADGITKVTYFSLKEPEETR
ncbi:MAG: L-serine ammonia-lyase, iron-sulfur-dependent subunit beta [Lachnospiraceae bacterium]|nr:L-serine ammonia-lyase, iron-sulfur-dependent subunit beta [Lachnospiraceae bacterium]